LEWHCCVCGRLWLFEHLHILFCYLVLDHGHWSSIYGCLCLLACHEMSDEQWCFRDRNGRGSTLFNVHVCSLYKKYVQCKEHDWLLSETFGVFTPLFFIAIFSVRIGVITHSIYIPAPHTKCFGSCRFLFLFLFVFVCLFVCFFFFCCCLPWLLVFRSFTCKQ